MRLVLKSELKDILFKFNNNDIKEVTELERGELVKIKADIFIFTY